MNIRILALAGLALTPAILRAQQPVLFYDFSNVVGPTVPNLGSNATTGAMTGAASIGSGAPGTGFSGGNVLNLDGQDGSYVNSMLPASTLGFSTDNYTASSWLKLNAYGGDSMVFGQTADVSGMLHNGVRDRNPHMGHWGADTTAGTNLETLYGSNWFHMTFRYRGDEQTIWVNGQAVAREFRGNLGNTGTNVAIGSNLGNGGGTNGSLDDVAVYNQSLHANQIEFLAAGGNPKALPAFGPSNQGYLGAPNSLSPSTIPAGPSVVGGAGQWAVREVQSGDANQPNNLQEAINVLRTPPASSQVFTGFTSTVNRRDPGFGASHLFTNDSPFLSDTAADDDRRAFLYRAKVKVTSEGDYTFGYHGDDGFALRIGNFNWTSNSPGDGNNGGLDWDDTRTLTFPVGTGDANVRGVIHLTPGEHNIELVAWEGTGGGSHELYYAPGAFVNDADASNWRLLGASDNTANIPSVTAAGWTVKTSAPGGTAITNINEAQADLTATGTITTGVTSLNYGDPGFGGGGGSASGDVAFPRDTVGVDDDDFAVLATATLTIDVGETYRFQFRGDDGGWMRINGQTGWSNIFSLAGGALTDRFGTAGIFDAVQADTPTGDSFTRADIFLAAGTYQIEAGFFERAGGGFWELMAGDADSGNLQLLAAGNNQALNDSAGQLQIVPEPSSAIMALGGFGALLGAQRLRRRR